MGVKADGKGMSSPKEVTPAQSVEPGVDAKGAPGGESGKGSWIKQEGPNSYRRGKD